MSDVQPYYQAYLDATGVSTYAQAKARDGGNAPYMRWIQAQWREWERLTGRREPHGPDARAAFGDWLARNNKPPNACPFPALPGIPAP